MLLVEDFVDKRVRNTTESESSAEQGRIWLHIFYGFRGRGEDFINSMAASCGGKCASYQKGLLEQDRLESFGSSGRNEPTFDVFLV